MQPALTNITTVGGAVKALLLQRHYSTTDVSTQCMRSNELLSWPSIVALTSHVSPS